VSQYVAQAGLELLIFLVSLLFAEIAGVHQYAG
jgi:hypothetical protein